MTLMELLTEAQIKLEAAGYCLMMAADLPDTPTSIGLDETCQSLSETINQLTATINALKQQTTIARLK